MAPGQGAEWTSEVGHFVYVGQRTFMNLISIIGSGNCWHRGNDRVGTASIRNHQPPTRLATTTRIVRLTGSGPDYLGCEERNGSTLISLRTCIRTGGVRGASPSPTTSIEATGIIVDCAIVGIAFDSWVESPVSGATIGRWTAAFRGEH